MNGSPPTYQEFADFWQKEFVHRKKEPQKPKDEWMFIRFVQMIEKQKPNASKKDILYAWKKVQNQKMILGFQLINKSITVLL